MDACNNCIDPILQKSIDEIIQTIEYMHRVLDRKYFNIDFARLSMVKELVTELAKDESLDYNVISILGEFTILYDDVTHYNIDKAAKMTLVRAADKEIDERSRNGERQYAKIKFFK